MSTSLQRIAASETIPEQRDPTPATDAFCEALADFIAYMKHAQTQDRQMLFGLRARRLRQCLGSVTVGGGARDAKRARRAAKLFLRAAARRFGTV